MRTVSALFDTYDEVTAAVDGLSDLGVPGNDITVVTRRQDAMTKIAEGAGLGAAIGGVGGLLAGFGMFVIPGLGSVFGIGWLIPLIIGAAAGGVAGGLIGSLTGAGIDEKDAHVYAEGICRGGTLLVARVHDDEAGEARAVLLKCGAIDTNSRRSEYAADGWEGFVAKDIWDDNAAVNAAIGGTDGVDADATASIGGTGGANAAVGLGVGDAAAADVGIGIGEAATLGAGAPGTGATGGLTGVVANMSPGQLARTKKQCRQVMSDRSGFDSNLVALCSLVQSASR